MASLGVEYGSDTSDSGDGVVAEPSAKRSRPATHDPALLAKLERFNAMVDQGHTLTQALTSKSDFFNPSASKDAFEALGLTEEALRLVPAPADLPQRGIACTWEELQRGMAERVRLHEEAKRSAGYTSRGPSSEFVTEETASAGMSVDIADVIRRAKARAAAAMSEGRPE
jgi:hypothetical protein